MLKAIGSKIKERTGDYVRTLQVVGYNEQNTHEVWELVNTAYNPLSIDYISLTPKRFE